MERWDIIFKWLTASAGALFGFAWGEWTPLLQVLLAFVVIDYLTGLLASGVEGQLSSKIGFRGIVKKLMIFAIVAVGHLIDQTIGDGHMFRDAVVFFFLGNELLSILENAGRTGLPLPSVLSNAVDILKGKGEGKK